MGALISTVIMQNVEVKGHEVSKQYNKEGNLAQLGNECILPPHAADPVSLEDCCQLSDMVIVSLIISVYFNFQQPKDTTRLDETMYVRLLLPELCKVTSCFILQIVFQWR